MGGGLAKGTEKRQGRGGMGGGLAKGTEKRQERGGIRGGGAAGVEKMCVRGGMMGGAGTGGEDCTGGACKRENNDRIRGKMSSEFLPDRRRHSCQLGLEPVSPSSGKRKEFWLASVYEAPSVVPVEGPTWTGDSAPSPSAQLIGPSDPKTTVRVLPFLSGGTRAEGSRS